MKNSRAVSYLPLFVISLLTLGIALYPTLSITEDADIAGLFAIVFSWILFVPMTILSILVFRFVQRRFNLAKISGVMTILVAVTINSFAVTYVPLKITLPKFSRDSEKAAFKVDMELANEEIVEVNNLIGDPSYPGINPTKYNYRFELKVTNNSGHAFLNLPFRARLLVNDEESYRGEATFFHYDLHKLEFVTLSPGETVVSGSPPIDYWATYTKAQDRL
ncbi:hypothetical protein A2873_05460 [Candidatus Woesebacteria bacterium RIFCSPHIGHO2_01_FULL_42_80]|uniref:Uncharacterized protein n=1 Tax=Candidatus Woesebacteria bacterium RIFCSPHIGHO2_12_FULL_41_24 TaxID=1802510 RepID=A0A1F8AV65_9BACT|nr:MAG: hypothetical protein A2873_05460 [Candidatus Woesebacteria bacterium RIFCSPHIGHO2_01_FULL_42_80]OGM55520.1 MAG: hypothetical protein A3E44_01195 [Candidatus Woesebacteria bacterium RIFCSPHIGHO2_12_FULL_41_24]OGM68243.1 MAG: hypothetical protein A2969_01095 [Candidatus Woesebacteria bacterium RIFCSPLOWO2_01_FULL_42_67]